MNHCGKNRVSPAKVLFRKTKYSTRLDLKQKYFPKNLKNQSQMVRQIFGPSNAAVAERFCSLLQEPTPSTPCKIEPRQLVDATFWLALLIHHYHTLRYPDEVRKEQTRTQQLGPVNTKRLEQMNLTKREQGFEVCEDENSTDARSIPSHPISKKLWASTLKFIK
jgi:hypothetical protein